MATCEMGDHFGRLESRITCCNYDIRALAVIASRYYRVCTSLLLSAYYLQLKKKLQSSLNKKTHILPHIKRVFLAIVGQTTPRGLMC